MQTIIGTLLDVTSRERQWPSGDRYVEHTAHILDGVNSIPVTLQNPSNDRPGLNPQLVSEHKGERVCLEVYGRGSQNKRVYLTALRVLSVEELAEALGLATV